MYNQTECIDAGTENCPCYLALTGDCLTCSRLQNKDCCDCQWSGVCIYNEFIQNNQQVNNPRKEFEADIVEKRTYMEDLIVYVLDVGKGFAIKASRPGTYIFMRSRESDNYYNTPISIMYSDIEKGHLHVAIKIISQKTKLLLEEEARFVIRGPYRNGIQGIGKNPDLTKESENILIFAKGLGMAPAVNLIHNLGEKSGYKVVLDTEKISQKLVEDYFAGMETHIAYTSFIGEDEERFRERLTEDSYTKVFILASNYYIDTIGKLALEILPNADVCMSNNFTICCGEGICGACELITVGGETFKMCKCQMSAEEILERRGVYV